MMPRPDYYQLLGLPRHAGGREVRLAYVRLLKRHYQPPASPNPLLADRLRHLQDAYRCLSDPAARAAHDTLLAAGDREHSQQARQVRRRLRRIEDRRYARRGPHAGRIRPALIATIAAAMMLSLTAMLLV